MASRRRTLGAGVGVDRAALVRGAEASRDRLLGQLGLSPDDPVRGQIPVPSGAAGG